MDAPVRTKPVMDRIESQVREAIRRRVTEHGGSTEYRDPVLFERVWSLLGRNRLEAAVEAATDGPHLQSYGVGSGRQPGPGGDGIG